MLFNSLAFAVFFPLVLGVYYVLRRRAQNVWLVAASWFFYGWWDYRFLTLLWISTVVDYFCGRSIAASRSPAARRGLLLLSIATNLSILGFFKYFNFFADSAERLLALAGMRPSMMTLEVILPLGISFYTFQTLSYTIDVYRGRQRPCRDFITFALFVSYFPQLVAGPIERASRLLPQLEEPRRVTPQHLREGGFLILLGLFKKVAVADAIGGLVDVRFMYPELCAGSDLLYCLYLFAVQIYCDFSGYSDVARGASKLLGIELMVNFDQPYFASSITEFWRRWHVSLSTWLRDYLYIPLGGNRHGAWMTFRNLMITMLLGGLWHGAQWTFVAWGGLHGLYLAVHRFVLGRREFCPPLARRSWSEHAMFVLKVLATFHLVCFAWVFFRADSFEVAWTYLTGMFAWQPAGAIEALSWTSRRILPLLMALLAIDLSQRIAGDQTAPTRLPWALRGLVCAGLLVALFAGGGIDAEVPFIYFQF